MAGLPHGGVRPCPHGAVDKNKDGTISFKEFLKVIYPFTPPAMLDALYKMVCRAS